MKLSIITVNLNNAIGLKKTIESVIKQNFSDYEYIVIDGASTDGSVYVINQFKDKINYWISEPDKGIYNAQNKGIEKAIGEYCLFLNSGDLLLDANVLINVFQNDADEDLLYGEGIFEKNDSEISYKYPDENNISFRFLMNTSLCHPSIFFKRKLFEIYGYYNENLMFAADWEFYLLAIFKYNISIRKINIPISKFDLNGFSSDLKNREKMFHEREDILKKHFRYFLKDYKELERLDFSRPMKVYRCLKNIILAPIRIFKK